MIVREIPFRGGSLSYRITIPENAGDNPCLVLVHGALSDSRFFHRQIHDLGKTYRIIAPDLPGHGRSSFSNWSGEDCIAAISEIITREDAFSSVILAHSMAGPLVLHLCHRQPSVARGLVFVSTASRILLDEKMRDKIDRGNFSASDLTGVVFSGRMAEVASHFLDTADPGFAGRLCNDLALCDNTDAGGLCSEIAVPVLCIASADDLLIPSTETCRLSESIPDSRMVMMDGSSHVPFLENWRDFNGILREYLRYLQ